MWGMELFRVTRCSDRDCCCGPCCIYWLYGARHTAVRKVVGFVWGDTIVKLRVGGEALPQLKAASRQCGATITSPLGATVSTRLIKITLN